MVKSLKKTILIFCCALLPMVFWGMSFVWIKIVYKYFGPITTVFLRLILATIFLSLVIIVFKKKEKVKKGDFKYFFLLAFFQPFCYFLGESFGVKFVSATLSSIIISTIPVVTPVFAFIFLKEKLTLTNIFGLFLSFFGVVVMIINPNLSLNASSIGLLSLGFAVLSAVFYSLIVKKISEKYSPFTIVNVSNSIGIFLFLPLFLVFELKSFTKVNVNFELISTLLLLAVLCSALAFVLLTVAIRELGVSKTNVFTNTIPVFTAIFAYLLLGEALTLQKFVGMVIVVSGLIVSQIKKKQKKENIIYFEA